MTENPVKNVYGEKIVDDEQDELNIWYKIALVLQDYNYELSAEVVDGEAIIGLKKLS